MPIQLSDEGPATITVILGYGDIGIGRISNDDYKGVGLVQLKDRFKRGEKIPEDQWNGTDTIKVCLILRNKRGLAELRKAVTAIEEEMGLSKQTMLDKITNASLTEVGDKEAEVERLTYDLEQSQDRIATLEKENAELKEVLKGAEFIVGGLCKLPGRMPPTSTETIVRISKHDRIVTAINDYYRQLEAGRTVG